MEQCNIYQKSGLFNHTSFSLPQYGATVHLKGLSHQLGDGLKEVWFNRLDLGRGATYGY
jgi:hypothetical protein